LNRFRRLGDQFAVDDCRRQLVEHPEETSIILHYLAGVGAAREADREADRLLDPAQLLHAYQSYQYLSWRVLQPQDVPEAVLKLTRRLAFERVVPEYVRIAALNLLASHGAPHDFERMELLFAEAESDLARAQLICMMRRHEPRRRNAFLGRLRDNGPLVRAAGSWVKSGTTPSAISGMATE
jgi:hypothetical protein